MPSRIPGRRRAAGLAGFAGLVLTIGLALTGCDPSADGGTKTSSSPTVAAPTTTVASVTAAPAAPTQPAATTEAAPAAAPTATAPAAAPPSHPQSAPPKAPQPKATTAQPPADTDPQHTAAAGGSQCEIRSNAGNCYAAGQFCRNDDLGKSTHDANGRVIYCRMVSGKPHWQA
ncbi:hypothetical protein ACGF07_23570 [Kitasatospora sp. NPDC048194]|uniref:hypothetical protein n=1 Tax=Kitasatospora sp. NPDC048194 TaxID=3364045 RepID=UPI003716BC19